jgi:gp16 family phage-associated protein
MPHMLCYKLIQLSSGIVGHGFQEAANRFLVAWSNASVLLNKSVFYVTESMFRQCCPHTIQNVRDVKTELNRDFAQVRRRRVTSSGLVVSLSSLGYSQCFRKLVLSLRASLPFFLQSGAYLFGKVQNNSSLIFTNASKCIIVHSTPHEIARNCTMPNTCITEQARKQAREALEKRGQSAKDFAKLHDLNPSTVYAVLSGQSHCRRGEAHRAAVLLGIKDGVIEQ